MSGASTPIVVLDSGSESDSSSSGDSPILVSAELHPSSRPASRLGQRRSSSGRSTPGGSSAGPLTRTRSAKKRKARPSNLSEGARPKKVVASSSSSAPALHEGSSLEPIVLEDADAQSPDREGQSSGSQVTAPPAQSTTDARPKKPQTQLIDARPTASEAESSRTSPSPTHSAIATEEESAREQPPRNLSKVSWPSAKSMPPPTLEAPSQSGPSRSAISPDLVSEGPDSSHEGSTGSTTPADADSSTQSALPVKAQAQHQDASPTASASSSEQHTPAPEAGSSKQTDASAMQGDGQNVAARPVPPPPLPPRPSTTSEGASAQVAPSNPAPPLASSSTAQAPHTEPSMLQKLQEWVKRNGAAVSDRVEAALSPGAPQQQPAGSPSVPGPLVGGQSHQATPQPGPAVHSTNAPAPYGNFQHPAIASSSHNPGGGLVSLGGSAPNPHTGRPTYASAPRFTSTLPPYPTSPYATNDLLNGPYVGPYPSNPQFNQGDLSLARFQPLPSHLASWPHQPPGPTSAAGMSPGHYGPHLPGAVQPGPLTYGSLPPGAYPPGSSVAGLSTSAMDAGTSMQDAAFSAISNIFSNVGQIISGAADTMGQLFQQDEEAVADMANLKPCSDAVLAQLKKAGLKTTLKTHQSSGLRFLVESEHRRAPQSRKDGEICLWTFHNDFGRPYWRNRVAVEFTTSTEPILPRGAILSDAMGLGKTLTVLALILTPEDGEGILDDNEEDKKLDAVDKKPEKQEVEESDKDVTAEQQDSKPARSLRRNRSSSSSSAEAHSDIATGSEKGQKKNPPAKGTPAKRGARFTASKTSSQSRRPLAKVESNGRPTKKKKMAPIFLPSRRVKQEDAWTPEPDELAPSQGGSQPHSEHGTPTRPNDDCDDGEDENPRLPMRSRASRLSICNDDTPTKRNRRLAIESGDDSERSASEYEPTLERGRKLAIESEDDDDDEESDGPVGSTRRRPLAIDSEEDDDDIWTPAPETAAESDEEEIPVKKPSTRRPTLIVCPLSVLSNWCDQASTHTKPKKMKYAVLHGPEGQKLRKENNWNKYNFIVTTYDSVRSSYKELGLLRAHRIRERRFERQIKTATRLYNEMQKRARKHPNEPSLQVGAQQRLERLNEIKDMCNLERKVTPLRGGKTAWTKQKVCLDREQRARQISAIPTASAPDSDSDSDSEGGVVSDGQSVHESDQESNQQPQAQGQRNGGFADNQLIYLWTGQHRKPENDRLFKHRWLRIVLDEAHVARNSSTNVYEALRHLRAERRIAVTGTPLVNSTCDLGSLAAWIGVFPFKKQRDLWNQAVEQPVKARQAAGINILRSITKSLVCLRTKEMKVDGKPIVELPALDMKKYSIELRSEDRDFYDRAEVALRSRIVKWAEEGELGDKTANILVFMARMRQLANDRRLVPENLIEEIETADYTGDGNAEPTTQDLSHRLSPQQIASLQNQLAAAIQNQQDCPVCSEPLAAQEAIITYCAHAYHRECITTHLESSTSCVVDQQALKKTTRLITLPEEDNADTAVAASGGVDSAKINALVEILNAIHTAAPTDKVVVFSNFVAFLKLASSRLKSEDIPHTTFYGAHNKTRRAQALASFARPLPMPKNHRIIESTTSRASSAGDRSSRQSSLLEHLERLGSDLGSTTSTFVAKKGKAKPLTAAEQRAEEDGLGKTIPRVILMSMGAGSVGINLTAANHVVLLDPWWQSALEMQARDRTHRIGQTKAVHVYRLVSSKTIEERVIEISTEKMELTKFALSGVQYKGKVLFESGRSSDARLKDLGTLFGLTEEDLTRINRARQRPAWHRS